MDRTDAEQPQVININWFNKLEKQYTTKCKLLNVIILTNLFQFVSFVK